MLTINEGNIHNLIESGELYIKTGLSWGRKFGIIEWLKGFVSPIKRPMSAKSCHVICMGNEGPQPLNPWIHLLFMGHDLTKPETIEFWAIKKNVVRQIKESTGKTVYFEGKTWIEYRNKNVVTAVFIEEPFELIDNEGKVFHSAGNYWVIYDHTTQNWFPCAPDKFKYTLKS
jgi:hypothetical protein